MFSPEFLYVIKLILTFKSTKILLKNGTVVIHLSGQFQSEEISKKKFNIKHKHF